MIKFTVLHIGRSTIQEIEMAQPGDGVYIPQHGDAELDALQERLLICAEHEIGPRAAEALSALRTRLTKVEGEMRKAHAASASYLGQADEAHEARLAAERDRDAYGEDLGRIILTLPMGDIRKLGAVEGVKALRTRLAEVELELAAALAILTLAAQTDEAPT